MGHYLRQIQSPNGENPIIIKLDKKEILIGRTTPGLNGYSALSKYHALVYKSDDGSISVKDMNSTNGVFVNGEKIGPEPKRLEFGNIIGFGVPSIFFNCNKQIIGFVCEFLSEGIDPEIIVEEVKITNPINVVIKKEKALKPQAVLYNSSDEEITIENVILPQPNPNEIEKEAKVLLVKVDSEEFQWTPDVKNPFEADGGNSNTHEERVARLASDSLSDDSPNSSSRSNRNKKFKKSLSKTSFSRSRKKCVRQLSPDSSEDAEEEIYSSSKSLRFKRIKKFPSESSDESDEGKTIHL